MYKIITPTGVLYITHKFMATVLANGAHHVTVLRPGAFNSCMRWCSLPIDKVVEPERKMFWLSFNKVLRGMGLCK